MYWFIIPSLLGVLLDSIKGKSNSVEGRKKPFQSNLQVEVRCTIVVSVDGAFNMIVLHVPDS
jgi:hypothetical protein